MTATTHTAPLPFGATARMTAAMPWWERAARATWRFLESMGRAHAQAELRRQAVGWELSNPELARLLRQTADQLP